MAIANHAGYLNCTFSKINETRVRMQMLIVGAIEVFWPIVWGRANVCECSVFVSCMAIGIISAEHSVIVPQGNHSKLISQRSECQVFRQRANIMHKNSSSFLCFGHLPCLL